jgi:hypothetical protein
MGEELLEVTKYNDIEEVRRLITNRVDINYQY